LEGKDIKNEPKAFYKLDAFGFFMVKLTYIDVIRDDVKRGELLWGKK